MSTLDSSSTLDDILAAYADNASYGEDASLTKARAFQTACRLLLVKLPQRSVKSGTEIELNVALVQGELATVTRWLASNAGLTAGGAGVKHVSLKGFRE